MRVRLHPERPTVELLYNPQLMETLQDWLAYKQRILHATEQLAPEEIKALSPDLGIQAFTQFVVWSAGKIRRLREEVSVLEKTLTPS
jgi:hypothetical protein